MVGTEARWGGGKDRVVGINCSLESLARGAGVDEMDSRLEDKFCLFKWRNQRIYRQNV